LSSKHSDGDTSTSELDATAAEILAVTCELAEAEREAAAAGIAVSIIDGTLDQWLDDIANALKERRYIIGLVASVNNKATLRPGTMVTLKGLSPRCLNGLQAVVVDPSTRKSPAPGHIYVRMLDRCSKYEAGHVVGVPAQCMEATK
jgi:hypothetical protein